MNWYFFLLHTCICTNTKPLHVRMRTWIIAIPMATPIMIVKLLFSWSSKLLKHPCLNVIQNIQHIIVFQAIQTPLFKSHTKYSIYNCLLHYFKSLYILLPHCKQDLLTSVYKLWDCVALLNASILHFFDKPVWQQEIGTTYRYIFKH